MKPISFCHLTLLLLFFAINTILAQPILTSNATPELGTNFQVSIVDPVPLGNLVLPAGEGIIWDFSASSVVSTRIATFVDAATTDVGIFFPNADIALSYDGDGLPLGSFNLKHDFFALFEDSLLNVGFTTKSGNIINYNNPATVFNYPFSFGDKVEDDFKVSFEVGSTTIVEEGTISRTADGFGKVLLPNKEMDNLLRVRTIRHYYQAFEDNVLDTIFFQEDRLTWYSANQIYPVLSVTKEIVSGSPTPQTRIYFTGDVETSIEEYLPIASIEAYPNPSSGAFQLKYDLLQSTDVQLNVYNSMGQLLQIADSGRQNAGSQTIMIDLRSQARGMYFVEMILNETERVVHKLIVQK
ncbi:MAG: T9SS type A sorting domain-containing protein [Chitinophagales bacterium]